MATTKKGLLQAFGSFKRCRIAIEAGTQPPWASRLLIGLEHEVIVADPRQLQLIAQSSQQAQFDLMRIRVRAGLVEARTALVNTLRGLAKSVVERVPACDPDALQQDRLEGLTARYKWP